MYSNIRSRAGGFGSRRRGYGRRSSKPIKTTTNDQYVNKSTDLPLEVPYQAEHTFRDFSLNQRIVESITSRGYVKPTPIQDQAIPIVMSGKDVIGLADTGTGKTAAFLLPLLHKMLRDPAQKALIIVPTRELAVQINDELVKFSTGFGIHSAVCIGGSGYGSQIQALRKRPQIVIGTPGRLRDHLGQRTLFLKDVQNLVIDEADRLVDMGFIKDVRTLVAELRSDRQTLFFSATMPSEVKGLVDSFLRDPITIAVKKRETSVNVDQDIVRYTDAFHRISLLHELLIKPEFKKVLIFGRTKHGVEKLCRTLEERGFSAVSIHGNKSQPQRQRALEDFKSGRAQIMVATDVAARGLDIPNFSHVINFEAPENYADYVHRIGRTGRADNKGIALTFVQ
jgi:superfamily II DNA/RNA helicase